MATSTTSVKQRPAAHSTIALKIMMAISGLFFVFYVLLHMYGNLKILTGFDKLDGPSGQVAYTSDFDIYAHHLRTFLSPILPYEGLLWIFRILLILALIVHAYSAITLWMRAKAARGVQGYQVRKALASGLTGPMMRWGGIALLLFVIFHLLNFTTKTVDTWGDGSNAASPATRVISTFQNPLFVLIYALALIALAMHLYHGVWSALTTLGFNHARTQTAVKAISAAVGAIVALGFLIPPLVILFGGIHIPSDGPVIPYELQSKAAELLSARG